MRSFALRKNLIRGGAAVLASSAIVIAVAAPGSAATTPIAYSDSNALNLSLLGSPISTGTVVSTTDGKTTTTTGNTLPTIQALGNQQLIPSTGVLVQNSKATMSGLDGVSQSCAGLAGSGGQVVAVGNGDCIKGGQQLQLNAGSVALGGLQISNAGILAPITNAIQPALQPILTPLLNALSSTLSSTLTALPVQLSLNLGAVSAWCTATPTSVAGNGNVAGASLVATVAGKAIKILDLPVNPAPNTHVLTNLDKVVAAVEAGLVTQLDNELLGATNALTPVIQNVLTTINQNLIAQIAPQLAPLETNILDGVLNAQTKTAAPHPTIAVTALDLKILPVAGNNGIDLRVGKVDCGPNYTANAVTPPTNNCQAQSNCPPPPAPSCQQLGNCPAPHSVSSGLAAGYLPTGPLGMALLGLTVAAAAGAGVTAGARALRKSA